VSRAVERFAELRVPRGPAQYSEGC
jgi:hypothetical protein